jgi:hypothetical protein
LHGKIRIFSSKAISLKHIGQELSGFADNISLVTVTRGIASIAASVAP